MMVMVVIVKKNLFGMMDVVVVNVRSGVVVYDLASGLVVVVVAGVHVFVKRYCLVVMNNLG